jgi:hypothetical protein
MELDEYIKSEDPNLYWQLSSWQLSSGQIQNLLDEAIEELQKLEKLYKSLWKHCTIKYHSEDSVSPIEHTPGKNEYAKNLIEHEMKK